MGDLGKDWHCDFACYEYRKFVVFVAVLMSRGKNIYFRAEKRHVCLQFFTTLWNQGNSKFHNKTDISRCKYWKFLQRGKGILHCNYNDLHEIRSWLFHTIKLEHVKLCSPCYAPMPAHVCMPHAPLACSGNIFFPEMISMYVSSSEEKGRRKIPPHRHVSCRRTRSKFHKK